MREKLREVPSFGMPSAHANSGSGYAVVGLFYKGYTATTTLDRSFGVVVVCQQFAM